MIIFAKKILITTILSGISPRTISYFHIKMKRYLALFFIAFATFLNARNIDLHSLENTIIQYNREGKHQQSQKKLSEILLEGDLTKEQEGYILYYMAATYRSVNDYLLCLEYLSKAEAVAEKLPKDNPLQMRIDYEYAFVHYDNKDYRSASMAMKYLADQHYKNTIPEDDSYILMQEGYLFLRDHRYAEAEKKYEQALTIMKNVNHCNLPIVMCKMMELYNQKQNIKKVEQIYHESEKIADSCGILKYKVFLAAELERIYKENNLFDKAYIIGLNLDSLRKLENQGEKISEMHIMDVSYLKKKESQQSQSDFFQKVTASVVATILLLIIIFSYFKRRSLKKDKVKMKREIAQMKEDLETYSQHYQNEHFVKPQLSNDDYDKLTERQKELLDLILDGMSNKQIAEKLFITESTVKYHIKNIYNILDIRDRKDLFKKLREA